MKKDSISKVAEQRAQYKLSDFSSPMVRGKYAKRIQESSNVVVLKPEVAEAFPNADAVNKALLSLIKIARTCTHADEHHGRRAKARG